MQDYKNSIEAQPLDHLLPQKPNVDLKRALDSKIGKLDIET